MYFGAANPAVTQLLQRAQQQRVAQMAASAVQPYAQGIPLPVAPRRQSEMGQIIEKLVNPEVWTQFDTVLIAPAATAANYRAYANFTNVLAQTAMFRNRDITTAGPSITSMTTTNGYVDFPFKAYGVGVEVWCDCDAPSNASQFTARQFVEAVTQGGSITLRFSTDPKFIFPISDCPGGGGLVYSDATDSRALGANQTAGTANNGFPSVQARVLWKEYILFHGQKTPFNVTLDLSTVALARINALEALTGNFSAGCRVKFWGYRGKSLTTGSPFRG